MDKFLKDLVGRLQITDAEVVSADDVDNWPAGKLDELISEGILTRIENDKGVVCNQCEENCFIKPNIRELPEGGSLGVFVCTHNPDIGRIEVDLNRLRQWRIERKRLSQMGYLRGKGSHKLNPTRREKREADVLTLQATFLKHHGFGKDYLNYDPITQKELQRTLNWSQAKVSRVMKAIFGNKPMSTYKTKCRTRSISGFLKKVDDGTTTVEAIYDPLEE